MLFPKLAIHISPFKLSHLANRGHLQFQNLRNTFNNINLGSTVAPNAPSVGSSAGGGLGAATGPSTAGGAGGAKWSAGSRAGWTQQSQGRLLTHANSATLDNQNSKQNDDDDVDEFPTHSLHNQTLYKNRNGTISSRWQHAQQNKASTVTTLALSSASLQARYKSAFTGHSQERTRATIAQLESNPSSVADSPVSTSLQFDHIDHSQQQGRSSDKRTSPGRRHSISGNCLDLSGVPSRSRRLSTSDAHNPTQLLLSRSKRLDSRPYSSTSTGPSELHQSIDVGLLPPHTPIESHMNIVPRRLPLDQFIPVGQPSVTLSPVDERWLKQSIHILSSADHQYTSFYRIRKLLDSYVSSTASPSTKLVDYMMWGFLMTKPSFEPIHALLRNYHHLLRNPNFKPSQDTYSIVITALCQRDISNLREIELRKSKLDDAMINQRLNQSLPNLSLAPVSSVDDVKVVKTLMSEPNFDHAVKLYRALSKDVLRLLQPAALEALIQACGQQSAFDSESFRGQQMARLDLAVDVFGNLESQGSCSVQSYASLIDVFGYSKDLTNAKEIFDDYRNLRAGSKSLLSALQHEYHLRSPDLTGLSPIVNSSTVSTHLQPQSQSADQVGDAVVLLSLMRAYLVNGDSISAVTLLEESLTSGTSDADTIGSLTSFGKITSDHILEIILGFVRLSDFRSASRWLKKLFNDEHALYDLDQSGRRIKFLDKIVRSCCQPERVCGGLDVANNAIKVSIEKMNPQLNPNASISLLHRMRQVLNCYLVRALQNSTLLQKDHQEAEATIAVGAIKDSLEKSADLLCDFINRRSQLIETQPEVSAALLNIQTFGMMENLLNRAIQTCHNIRRAWVTAHTSQSKELTEICQITLIKLLSHYSIIPDHNQIESEDVELQYESSSLAGLLTCHQSLISSPVGLEHAKFSDDKIHSLHLQFALKITTPVIINNMSLVLATQLFQLYSACSHHNDLFQSINDWLVILTAGAILEVQVQEGTTMSLPSLSKSILEPLLVEFERALSTEKVKLTERDPAIDLQLLIQVIDCYKLTAPTEGRLSSLFDEVKSGAVNSMRTGKQRLQRYRQEGSQYVANRFSALRDRETQPSQTSNSSEISQLQSPAATVFAPSSAPTTLPSPSFSPSQSNDLGKSHVISPPPQLPSSPFLSQAVPSSLPQSVVPAPHPPFHSFNEHLSQIALSMFCSKDLPELDHTYRTVHESTTRGSYLTPDASSALIETFGRLGQLERMREMYVYAHVGLASVDGATQKDQASRSTSWIRVEDRMIIGLAYCGALDELAIHKHRLMNNGAAPSADAYAAMIQHARETTDDASVALACFEEAIQHRVIPNTFLCNTIISKLSKARRAPEALQVFDYMKQNNLPRNSVTFGAIINACCKTGDEKTAETLFKEMLRSKYYKPRVPPFNTMIQLYTQGVKKPNREKVLYYFDEMIRQKISPTDHTYNLLMQAYGFIEPHDPASMQDVFERACRDRNVHINGAHWSTLISVKGNIEKDLDGTLKLFDSISTHPTTIAPRSARYVDAPVLPDAVCYEALFNVLLALKKTDLIPIYAQRMTSAGVHMTAYVVNTLIKAHASSGNIQAARDLFESLVDPAPGQAAAFNHPAPVASSANAVNRYMSSPSPQKLVGRVSDPVFREPSSWQTMIQVEIEYGTPARVDELIKRMENRAYPNALLTRTRKLFESAKPATTIVTE
ncbi:hypothetical protein CROQUDRAFT_670247 [Cronartium quercuum f. sp. fusiforme G11]|uniref:Pentacotripeptide-repeat region of PRORP domain-containing protein n=1 Tax=Cronartium quercuum f. sp. fusiforme G11 TaxID=708437 RepID=A0A9P6NQZ3_9BASI|nr:hypothetical protein CROQUDRAFT_670247 [Cronartium quercuum f. sp. fusiforme G11]